MTARIRALTLVLLVCPVAVEALPSAGVYDENVVAANTVDFTATGSAVTLAQFKSDVLAAFNAGFGAVLQCETGGINAFDIDFAGNTKRVRITAGADTTLGVGGGAVGQIQPISNGGRYADITGGGFVLNIGPVVGGPSNEPVSRVALTILSQRISGSPVDHGTVTGTATFSGGGSASATRTISETDGAGDTFYSFAAPTGESITSISFTQTGIYFLNFDDLALITPEPSAPALLSIAAAGLCRRSTRSRARA